MSSCARLRQADPPHLHVVKDFEEGEGHSSADDHLIHLIQHVIDQLDLIFHLRSRKKKSETSVLIREVRNIKIKTHKKPISSEGMKQQNRQTFRFQELRAILLISSWELINNYSTEKQFKVDELIAFV